MAYGACDSPDASTAKRITYVIGSDGRILQVYEHVSVEDHAETLLAALSASTHLAQQDTFPAVALTPYVCSCTLTTEGREKALDTRKTEAENAHTQEAMNADLEGSMNQPSVTEVRAADRITPVREVAASPPVTSATAAPLVLGSTPSVTPSQVPPTQEGRTPSLGYALGALGYDYGTEARRDSIMQHMGESANPDEPRQLLDYLDNNPWDAAAILWTLRVDATPIYVVQPQGPFAGDAYHRLRQFLREQLTEGVERVSIPGIIVGRTRLLSGQLLPVIWPALRCMYSWTTAALVQAVCGSPPPDTATTDEQEAYAQKTEAVANFLERIYHELRNLGLTPQERSLNYAATNALNVERVFESALRGEMELDTIEVERSPICRPDSDCWDVKLTFFDPRRQLERARRVYRFTVDVSDVCPVTVGKVRSWSVR